jgi:hypothetical protein
LAVRSLARPALTTIRQAILHSLTGIMVAVEDAMADMDKAECSIARILPLRNHRCRESNNCTFESLGA